MTKTLEKKCFTFMSNRHLPNLFSVHKNCLLSIAFLTCFDFTLCFNVQIRQLSIIFATTNSYGSTFFSHFRKYLVTITRVSLANRSTFPQSIKMISRLFLGILISLSSERTQCDTKIVLNNRPIIGILAQSTKGTPVEKLGTSYIDAAYVKYIESSGARVVPIKTSLNEEEVINIFKSVNGVLFPGGDVSVTDSDYARIGNVIYKQAITAFCQNDYFPLWGICLGFELLATMVSGSSSVLSHSDSENLPLPLNFTPEYRKSRLFADISPELAQYISTAPTTLNLHQNCVSTETFKANKQLKNFFNVLSTNNDRNGKQFVSTMEGTKYPFYSTQWHPEKNSFEWSTALNIPHYPMSVKVTQYMSNFFVNQTRYSRHKFKSSREEQAQLIYNYPTLYTGNISNWEQTYIF